MDNGSEAGGVDTATASFWQRIGTRIRDAWLTARRGLPEQKYAERTLKRMAAGRLRDTLGIQVRDEAATREKGELWLAQMIELGLRPEHLCVEYGCGSLWCAEPVIRYLQPARFVGLDVTDGFYALGRQRLGSLLAEKQVHLAVISRQSLTEVAALRPDFVFSHRVLHHVPPRGLARYVRSISTLLHERTVLVIESKPRPNKREKTKEKVRRYRAADIQAHLPQNWMCRAHPFGFVITHRDFAG
jgi:hypothetical protein